MPKVYSDAEREDINNRLIEEASYALANFGVKKTTVDKIVKKVNIPKGTFYLFYESKESLFFRALLELHKEIEEELIVNLDLLHNKRDIEEITELIFRVYLKADKSGLLRLMTTGEIELIYKKLPKKVLEEHLQDDIDFFALILTKLQVSPKINTEYLSTAFRTLFLTMIYKREIGEDELHKGLRLCVRGLVIQMLE